jgi:hypothetical protein
VAGLRYHGHLPNGVGFGLIPEAWVIRVPLLANVHQIHFTTISTAVVLLSVVCAVGVESLLIASRPRVYFLTLVAGLISAWLIWDAVSVATDPLQIWLIGLLLTSAAALPLCALAVRQAPGRVLPVVGVVSLGALSLLPGGFHIETGMPSLDRLVAQPRPRVDLEMHSPAVDAVHRAMAEPSRVVGVGQVLFSGSQALFDLEGIGGPVALYVNDYEELVGAARIERPWPGESSEGGGCSSRHPTWLAWLRSSTCSTSASCWRPSVASRQASPKCRFSRAIGSRSSVGPRRGRARFSWTASRHIASLRRMLEQIAQRRTPLAAVQSTDSRAMEATRGMRAPSGHFIPARDYKLTTNSTRFFVRASGPGVAVLTETFIADDFRATLNGQRVPYFRVNHAFKGVAIPSAGEWTVTFE